MFAPIVIEVGLDYNAEHLAGDALKLINSKPAHGYLVHLVRELPRVSESETIILEIGRRFGIKTAYAWRQGNQAVFKLTNDKELKKRYGMVPATEKSRVLLARLADL